MPKSAKFTGIDQILFAWDELKRVETSVKDKIRNLAQELKAKVAVLHIEEEPVMAQAAQPNIPEEFEQIDCSYKNQHSDNVIRGIEEEIKNINAQLLILIPLWFLGIDDPQEQDQDDGFGSFHSAVVDPAVIFSGL